MKGRDRTFNEPDPFDLVPAVFDVAELRWFVEHRGLEPEPGSPLRDLGDPPPGSEADPQATRESLRAKGLLPGAGTLARFPSPPRRAPLGQSLVRALEILARPQVRLRLGIARPDQTPSTAELWIANGEAALGQRLGDRFHAGAPMPLGDLVATLTRDLASAAPPAEAGPALALWPMIAELAATLWPPGAGLGPVARETALARFSAACGEASAAPLLDGLLRAEVAVAGPEGIAARPAYAPWLERLLSGFVVEIEATAVESGATDRLTFVGPPGRRVACGFVGRADLLAHGILGPAGIFSGEEPVGPPAEQALLLAHLPPEALAVRLRELLEI